MTNDVKVGDKLRRVTDSSAHFTMGNDYEVLEADRGLIQVNDDEGWRYNLGEESVRVNFTIIRETPQFVRDLSEIRAGSFVRVIDAQPDLINDTITYENGDIFEVGYLWSPEGGGITTTQGLELFFSEVEKVVPAEASAKVDLTLGSPGIATDAVNQPSHYTNGKFETIEVIEEITKGYKDGFIAYDIGNVTKYLARAPYKHDTPLEDLRKAARYLDYAIKRQEELERS